MAQRKNTRSRSTKSNNTNWLLIIFVFLLIAWLLYVHYFANTGREIMPDKLSEINIHGISSSPNIDQVIKDLPNNSSSGSFASGVTTTAGVIKTVKLDKKIYQENLTLNGRVIPNLHSYSPIQLLLNKDINNHKLLLITTSMGGNECSYNYRIIDVYIKTYTITDVFGQCMDYNGFSIESNKIEIKFKSTDKIDVYHYSINNKAITVEQKTINSVLSAQNSKQIIDLANSEGCAKGSIIYMDKSCDDGAKYCKLFSKLPKNTKHDKYYKILNNFCN